jgi:hypothetical protein
LTVLEGDADPILAQRFPPNSTPLAQLSIEKRKLILHTVLLLLLSIEEYSAFSRQLMLYITSSLHISLRTLQADEFRIAFAMGKVALEVTAEQVEFRTSTNKASRKASQKLAINMADAGRLSTVFISEGIGSIPGGPKLRFGATAGLLGNLASNGIAVGGLFGMYASKGVSKLMQSSLRDLSDFALLTLHGPPESTYRAAEEVLPEQRRLRMTIAISGWVTRDVDFLAPWKCLRDHSEAYSLKWEPDNISSLGDSIETVIKSTAWRTANKEISSQLSMFFPFFTSLV